MAFYVTPVHYKFFNVFSFLLQKEWYYVINITIITIKFPITTTSFWELTTLPDWLLTTNSDRNFQIIIICLQDGFFQCSLSRMTHQRIIHQGFSEPSLQSIKLSPKRHYFRLLTITSPFINFPANVNLIILADTLNRIFSGLINV